MQGFWTDLPQSRVTAKLRPADKTYFVPESRDNKTTIGFFSRISGPKPDMRYMHPSNPLVCLLREQTIPQKVRIQGKEYISGRKKFDIPSNQCAPESVSFMSVALLDPIRLVFYLSHMLITVFAFASPCNMIRRKK